MIVGDEIDIYHFKEEIKLLFMTKEEGDMKVYKGCMVERKNDGIFLQQTE